MAQARKGRRGDAFAIRITEDERERLRVAHRSVGGPRALGPWMIWRALGSGADALPRQAELALRMRDVDQAEIDARVPLAERTILDLCAGSGSWSEPYARAGYNVVRWTLPAHDVRMMKPPTKRVWGIVAAPPCDQFSLARNGHDSPRDIPGGMSVVNGCMRLVLQTKPRWWALENPVGMLSRFLGTARDVWDPCDFGDPWTKRTAIWGEFTIPRRGPHVLPLGGGPFCSVCDPSGTKRSWCNDSAHRAITPAGFARAFYEANP